MPKTAHDHDHDQVLPETHSVSTSKDRADAVIAENVIDRVLDRKSYLELKRGGQKKSKIFLVTFFILICLPLIAWVAQATGYDQQGYEFVTLLCIFLFILVGVVNLIAGLLLLSGASATKTDVFVSDNEALLQRYFIDFVKAKLPHESKTYCTMFDINTIVDDSNIDARALKMIGLCRFSRSTTELSVTLRFNPSYTKLMVQKYDAGGLEK